LGGKLNFFFSDGIAEQTEKTFRNIEVLLRAAGPCWTTSYRPPCKSLTLLTLRSSAWCAQGSFRARPTLYERPCAHLAAGMRVKAPSSPTETGE
jgi:hypothetical protein